MKINEYPPGATPLTPEEFEALIPRHITSRDELNRWEQENIADAIAWLRRRRNKQSILNEDFILMLHYQMFKRVWLWAGTLRRTERNIGVPWIQIPVQLRGLLRDMQYWIANQTYTQDEIAARFHHRLVKIHLFPNGNGRHARLIAETLLTDLFKVEPFSWGNGDLSTGDIRERYIGALRAADEHDYALLLGFTRS